MSNTDLNWTEENKAAAAAEGWELAMVVDEGKPVASAYLEIFDKGPRFENRRRAQQFVISQAQARSVLHLRALSACSASRMQRPATAKRKKS